MIRLMERKYFVPTNYLAVMPITNLCDKRVSRSLACDPDSTTVS